MCGARLFAVRVILLQRYKVLPARPPDFGSLPMLIIQVSPYFDPTYTRTGWIGQPPVLDRHEVVTIDGDVDTLRQATP